MCVYGFMFDNFVLSKQLRVNPREKLIYENNMLCVFWKFKNVLKFENIVLETVKGMYCEESKIHTEPEEINMHSGSA